VIGGGPAGLAAARNRKAAPAACPCTREADSIGSRWRHHYDRLHLHTTRRMSALPGLASPTGLRPLGVARRLRPLPGELRQASRPRARARDHRESRRPRGRTLAAAHVKGGDRGPVRRRGRRLQQRPIHPAWPGRDAFGSTVLHSQNYRNGSEYKGKRVLVVGSGNTGAEIATDLVEHGAEVWWSFRTSPTIPARALRLGSRPRASGSC